MKEDTPHPKPPESCGICDPLPTGEEVGCAVPDVVPVLVACGLGAMALLGGLVWLVMRD